MAKRHAQIGAPGTRAKIVSGDLPESTVPVAGNPAAADSPDDSEDASLLKGLKSDAEVQEGIDRSITRELEGVEGEIAGVQLRALSMSEVMRLHQVGNEIMAGKKVGEMNNATFAALEFLYMMDTRNEPEDLARQAFGPLDDWRILVSQWALDVPPCDSLISDVIEFINDATSNRVTSRLPKALEGRDSEGNASRRRGP